MFGRIGPMELVLIFSIALIIFGPKKLPEIGKAVGSAIQNFKRHSSNLTEGLVGDENTQAPAAKIAETKTAEASPESSKASEKESVKS